MSDHDSPAPEPALPTPPAPRTTRDAPPWEQVLHRCWGSVAISLLAGVSLAFIVWSVSHHKLLFDYILQPENPAVRDAQSGPRRELLHLVVFGLAAGTLTSAWLVRRVRRGHRLLKLDLLLPVLAAIGLPFLFLPTVEFEHPYLTGIVMVGFALAVAVALRTMLIEHRARLPELSSRRGWIAVVFGWCVFTGVMGFLAHWRYITFHAQPYDTAWETNAVWGIVHHGIPTISTGADSYYRTQHLPTPYFDLHVPLAYYVYAPFFALWQDARVILWLQAAWMGAGAFGAYLCGRAWLRTRWAGVAVAWIYLLNPFIQNFCLHDIHANVLAVPTLLIAMGLMEAGRFRAALAVALLAALCREETGLYAACLGLFWTFGGGDRRRVRAGLLTTALSLIILLLIVRVLMPAFGGQPRWSHFSFFFGEPGMLSQLEAFVLNPLGALVAAGASFRAEFFFLAFLPMGFLALFGWRGGWFLLLVASMMVASSNLSMFSPGVNYSAPMMPAVLVMSFLGMRAFLLGRRNRSRTELGANRAAIVAYALVVAILGNLLYGNILAKTYKLEYGEAPYRRQRQYDYKDHLGYVTQLPAYGNRERDLWQAIRQVPPDVAVSASWSLSAQFAARAVGLTLPYLAESNPPDNRVTYVIIDKLPPMIDASERHLRKFRADPAWSVTYENRHAVVFKRR